MGDYYWLTIRAVAIITATLTAASAAEPPADLVLTGANVITMDVNQPTAQAIACRDGRIIAIGSDNDVADHIGDKTQVVRLGGLTVVPGIIEGHGHFISLGQSKMVLDLTQAKRWQDVIEMVTAAAEVAPPGEWIVGRGWHQSKWDRPPNPNVDGYPVHAELSRVTPRNPVLLVHASGHASFANALAMKIAGVTQTTRNPDGGEILRDPSGQPTGVFRETAQALVSYDRKTHLVRSREIGRAIELATHECLRNGITSFQDAGSSFAVIDRFQNLARQGRLKVRMWVMIRESNARLRRSLSNYRMVGIGDNHLTVRAIKRSIDGALGAHGAWLLEPYADAPNSTGLQTSSIKSLRETAELAVEHEMQLCVHAIGDRANREVLDLFAMAFENARRNQSRRWRIEHAQHLHPRDIPRFAKLGVIASMQSIHCTSDAVFVIDRLGQQRAKEGAYVWRSLLQSGAVVTNGTDAPVENVSPLRSLYAAVTRRLPDGTSFFPDQRMTRKQALRSYTLDAAYAAFEEESKGSLATGKLADIVVLSRNILGCPEEQILTTQIVHTIVGGKILYSADAETKP